MKNYVNHINNIFVVILLTMTISCIPSNKDRRLAEFERYLDDAFNISKPRSGMYFFIQPTCFECAKGILDMIAESSCEEMIVISLGPITDKNKKLLIDLAKNKKVMFDKTDKAMRYELGIEKAMFMHLEDGSALKYGSFGDYQAMVVQYINENCKRIYN
jgi:hypothetical protein